MDNKRIELHIVEQLRKGIPPQYGVNLYSVGNERLIEDIKERFLKNIENQGIIRFICGSWGSGKTHFFRQLREIAFNENFLVSNVELDVNSAALNKFQTVFAAIVRQINSPMSLENYSFFEDEIAPFGRVLTESLSWLANGEHEIISDISFENYSKAIKILMDDQGIDIDFKKMIQKYWETYLPDAPDKAIVQQTRGEILQWFSGEGSVAFYRKKFGVSKIISKENAKLMLQSLANFVRLSGYKGLLILFDEAEQAYSVMRKSSLREAHNNLLSLINNIEKLTGLFLIYATTPDFYTDPKHGIVIYGALSGRIGKPTDKPPKALDIVWNFDAVETDLTDYQKAAQKIRKIYINAYREAESLIPDEKRTNEIVEELFNMHPRYAPIRFWRLMVTALIATFDEFISGGTTRDTKEIYTDIMDMLRDN